MRIFAIDTETTGLPKTDRRGNADFALVRMTELAVCEHCGDYTREASWLVRIPEGAPYDPKAEAVSGISRELLARDGVDESEAMIELARWAELDRDEPRAWLGHNIYDFDWPIVSSAAMRSGWLPEPDLVLDTKHLFCAYMLGMRRREDEPLAYFFGRVAGRKVEFLSSLQHQLDLLAPGEEAQQHRALGDARQTLRLWQRMVDLGIDKRVLGEWQACLPR